ncbi:MAG: hypothetical protein OXN17_12965 [Candidatus Poribacteria bacterium]|nr:hypothetical protein [Candidatus Poribacteria bacterium]MDE0506221.1 hypothetical protein [Candidatus Poribacteria bacterium]
MSSETKVEERLSAVEDRLDRLENLLVGISQKLDKQPRPAEMSEEKGEALKGWVTDYVSMRLQQLVPETCDHPAESNPSEGPFLGNTSTRCTEEVVHRVKRIPIPFVREMVVQRVAENARNADVNVVDIEFFEKAATF